MISHMIGYVNKVAIDKEVLNELNFVSWWIDLELITYVSKCKNKYMSEWNMYMCE